jgi:hypothetical protein
MRLIYAKYFAMFAFFSFALRSVDLEINGTKVPVMLLSAVGILAWVGLWSLLVLLLNPHNTVNRSSKE